MDRSHIYIMQILFATGITVGSQSLDLANKHTWAVAIARYVVYALTVQASKSICVQVYDLVKNGRGLDSEYFNKLNKNQLFMYLASLTMLFLNDQKFYTEDFLLIFIAYLIVKYPDVEKSTPQKAVAVTYGSGMACSFIEGYLVHVIPSDGGETKGFQDKIRAFESTHGVVFPVKRMFLIVTKSMHCPPDLKEFNDKSDREDVNRLEACLSLEEVVKDVAGVKRRNYKNSAYKILRHAPGARPVYVAAECASPLHTLYKVVKNRHLYDELADANVDDIVTDFVTTLRKVLDKSPELKNKCELVYFDDTDESLNLADVLLDRIRELEPKFEEFINRRH